MTFLRWGLLSTARINRAIIPPLRASARNRVTAVASRDQATGEAYAREWNIARVHGSYEALLADPDIDVVYISLPNHLHVEWARRALLAGKHVLCEKPLALRPAEVDQLAETARQTGRVVTEAFMYRHHPQTLKIKELAAGGAIGELRLITGTFSFTLTRPQDVRLNPEWGGGALWDVGCYPVSFARWVAGAEPEVVFGQQVTGRSGIDELFLGQLQFPGQVHARFDCAFCLPYRAHLEVVGTTGSLEVTQPFKPGAPAAFTLRQGDQTETITVPGPDDLYLGEVEDLADAVLLGRPPRISLAESRGNAAALAALLDSARRGQPVRVPAAA